MSMKDQDMMIESAVQELEGLGLKIEEIKKLAK